MKILVTGAKGFVGKNLVESLKNIRDGKDRTRSNLLIDEIYEFDRDTDVNLLDEYCSKCDFIFNLAGVNRPKDNSEFMEGNFGFASTLFVSFSKYLTIYDTSVFAVHTAYSVMFFFVLKF